MNAGEFAEVLTTLSDLLRSSDKHEIVEACTAFAALLRTQQAKPVISFVKVLEPHVPQTSRADPKGVLVSDFGELLTKSRALFAAAGAKQILKDLDGVIAALLPHGRSPLVELAVKEAAAKPGRKPAEQPHSELIERWTSELRSAGLDETAFGAVMEKLSKPRAVKKDVLIEIANEYISHLYSTRAKRAFKTAALALDSMWQAFGDRLRAERRGQTIDRFVGKSS